MLLQIGGSLLPKDSSQITEVFYAKAHEYSIEDDTTIVCRDLNQTDCDRQTCECDKSVALCFRKQMYNEKHRNFLNIYCQGATPNCSIYERPREEACSSTSSPPPALS